MKPDEEAAALAPHERAALLERTLASECDPALISRYTFHLAQSYRDCGEREKALASYLKRSELGGSAEEIFESLLNAGRLHEALGHPAETVIATYVRASEIAPTRAEALHAASRYCRLRGRNQEGYQFAKRGLAVPRPNDGGLSLEGWVYEYGLLDELAVNGYWTGRYAEALDACITLLEGAALPRNERNRVVGNARFALGRLNNPPNLGELGKSSAVDQFAIGAKRNLHSRLRDAPRVLVAVLAKQKEEMLPLYLDCIEALDYPKSSISLYLRTNNNTDRTAEILRSWLDRVQSLYFDVEFDDSDVDDQVQNYGIHEWNATRFRVLGRIRNKSMARALEKSCDYYFVVDVDNFIRPATLRELVALDLPVVAPLLRVLNPHKIYSNYHANVDSNGYYKECDQYMWILNRWIRGVIEVPVVHTTYLVRADIIPMLSYDDNSARYEYVIFSDSARKAGVSQYIDNRQVYGYIAFGRGAGNYVEGGVERARALLSAELAPGQGGEAPDPSQGPVLRGDGGSESPPG
jgi:tetratricopeptide (TPR) repeat protein